MEREGRDHLDQLPLSVPGRGVAVLPSFELQFVKLITMTRTAKCLSTCRLGELLLKQYSHLLSHDPGPGHVEVEEVGLGERLQACLRV